MPVVQSGVAQTGSRGAAPGWLCPRRGRAASGAAAGRGGDGWPPSTAPGGRGGDGRPLLFFVCDWPLEGGRHPRLPASRQGNACTHASAIASSEEWQGCDQYVLYWGTTKSSSPRWKLMEVHRGMGSQSKGQGHAEQDCHRIGQVNSWGRGVPRGTPHAPAHHARGLPRAAPLPATAAACAAGGCRSAALRACVCPSAGNLPPSIRRRRSIGAARLRGCVTACCGLLCFSPRRWSRRGSARRPGLGAPCASSLRRRSAVGASTPPPSPHFPWPREDQPSRPPLLAFLRPPLGAGWVCRPPTGCASSAPVCGHFAPSALRLPVHGLSRLFTPLPAPPPLYLSAFVGELAARSRGRPPARPPLVSPASTLPPTPSPPLRPRHHDGVHADRRQ